MGRTMRPSGTTRASKSRVRKASRVIAKAAGRLLVKAKNAVKPRVVYDCVTCGACCYNPNDNREIGYIDYVEIEPSDRIMRRPDLVRRLVVLDDNLIPHMRLNRHHRCDALTGRLGVKVGCSIYHDRPSICRRFSAGSAKCKELRRERGIDA